jgi:hypothetical protein
MFDCLLLNLQALGTSIGLGVIFYQHRNVDLSTLMRNTAGVRVHGNRQTREQGQWMAAEASLATKLKLYKIISGH